ncbi:MAG: amidohydrolase family protein [Chloroflexi bacterium]|nr:amidohydrolase family protein [Chloroflexota bacterium]
MSAYRIIDADGHVAEQLPQAGIDWAALLPERYKHMAPRHFPFHTGGGRMFIEGKITAIPQPGGHAMSGKDLVDVHAERPGMWDPHVRMKHMDIEGIDTAVLYGGAVHIGVAGLDDPGFAAALARAYNDLVASYADTYTKRLKAVAALALPDVEASVLELRRCVKDLGFVGAGVAPNTHGRNLASDHFDPLFAEAQRLDVPICIHLVAPVPGIPAAAHDRFDRSYYIQLTAHPFEQMIAVATFIGEGVLDRFPRLRVAFMEGNCGWAPFWMDRMNEYHEVFPNQVRCKRRPSEYLLDGQCYISCGYEEKTLPYVVDVLGEDRIVFASDYWHFDAKFPGAVAAIKDRTTLRESAKRKILGANAARLYVL